METTEKVTYYLDMKAINMIDEIRKTCESRCGIKINNLQVECVVKSLLEFSIYDVMNLFKSYDQ